MRCEWGKNRRLTNKKSDEKRQLLKVIDCKVIRAKPGCSAMYWSSSAAPEYMFLTSILFYNSTNKKEFVFLDKKEFRFEGQWGLTTNSDNFCPDVKVVLFFLFGEINKPFALWPPKLMSKYFHFRNLYNRYSTHVHEDICTSIFVAMLVFTKDRKSKCLAIKD